MDFHDFAMILGNLGVETDHPPKMCAGLAGAMDFTAPPSACTEVYGVGETDTQSSQELPGHRENPLFSIKFDRFS